MRLKWVSAIAGDWPMVKGAGGSTSIAEAPPSAAMRAMGAASMLPSANIPLTIGNRSPISGRSQRALRLFIQGERRRGQARRVVFGLFQQYRLRTDVALPTHLPRRGCN